MDLSLYIYIVFNPLFHLLNSDKLWLIDNIYIYTDTFIYRIYMFVILYIYLTYGCMNFTKWENHLLVRLFFDIMKEAAKVIYILCSDYYIFLRSAKSIDKFRATKKNICILS